jgi:hypothetical protein
LPCAFALLTNITIPTYRCLISELKDGAAKIKLILNPKIVMIDFKQAVMNAFLYHFPSITIKLLFFSSRSKIILFNDLIKFNYFIFDNRGFNF